LKSYFWPEKNIPGILGKIEIMDTIPEVKFYFIQFTLNQWL